MNLTQNLFSSIIRFFVPLMVFCFYNQDVIHTVVKNNEDFTKLIFDFECTDMCLDQHTLVYVLQLCVLNACGCTSGWTLSASLPAKNCFHLTTRFFALIEILQHNELLPKTYSTPKSVYKS